MHPFQMSRNLTRLTLRLALFGRSSTPPRTISTTALNLYQSTETLLKINPGVSLESVTGQDILSAITAEDKAALESELSDLATLTTCELVDDGT